MSSSIRTAKAIGYVLSLIVRRNLWAQLVKKDAAIATDGTKIDVRVNNRTVPESRGISQEREVANCVWDSIIYLGHGGPVVREVFDQNGNFHSRS